LQRKHDRGALAVIVFNDQDVCGFMRIHGIHAISARELMVGSLSLDNVRLRVPDEAQANIA
jgi:hypothetical protein